MDDLLTTAEAARELGVSPSRVRRMASDGQVPATKRGRDLFIRRADLDMVRERRPGPPRAARATMTVYHTPSLPQHWILRTPEGDLFLVPVIPSGWEQRRPYRGHVRGLTEVRGETARLALVTAGLEPGTYPATVDVAARSISVRSRKGKSYTMSKRYAVRTIRNSRAVTGPERKPYAVVDLTDPAPDTRVVLRCAGQIEAQVECARLNRENP